MKSTLLSIVLVPLTVLGVIAGGLAFVEFRAQSAQADKVTAFVKKRFPDEQIEAMNVRGRPYVVSQMNGEVQLAYVYLKAQSPVSEHMLLLHRLRDDRNGEITRQVKVPYAEAGTTPKLDADGSFTDKATVNGRPVTFSAAVRGDALHFAAQGGKAPGPVRLSTAAGAKIRNVSAGHDGIKVEYFTSQ